MGTKRKKIQKIGDSEFHPSSGNIYEDLGYPNPEEAKAKAELASQIHEAIKARKLTQAKAAKLMEIDQPRVSDIIRGKLSKYSIDRLIRFLRALGRDVEIRVKKHEKRSSYPTLSVTGVSKSRAIA